MVEIKSAVNLAALFLVIEPVSIPHLVSLLLVSLEVRIQ
ncbi:hypothetical protein AC062_1032 [Pasteurellaceae bacterium NI1060]|nr:hypothetical protein AC062_1032 [Pasteurellaceae bacterium NI1060]